MFTFGCSTTTVLVYCCVGGRFAYHYQISSGTCPIGSRRTVGAGDHMKLSYPGNQTEIYTSTSRVAQQAEQNHSWRTCSNNSFRNLPDDELESLTNHRHMQKATYKHLFCCMLATHHLEFSITQDRIRSNDLTFHFYRTARHVSCNYDQILDRWDKHGQVVLTLINTEPRYHNHPPLENVLTPNKVEHL